VILNEPDCVLPGALGKPGRSISTLFRLVFSLAFALTTDENTPLPPTIAIGSSTGTALPLAQAVTLAELFGVMVVVAGRLAELELDERSQFAPFDVIIVGYARSNVVVVKGEFASNAPVTRMPAPVVEGSAVCAA